MNILKKIRNNWKKTVFGTGLLIYTTKYLYDRNELNRLHQAYCYEALKYSKEKVAPTQKIRRITVFLNPISNNERGKSLYEKYVSPMFSLSGLDVRLVRLDGKNEAKQYMEVIDDQDTDCIVIAGGNRTICEAISALVNRNDSEQIFNRIKVGIIPLSEKSSFAENLFNLNLKKDAVKLLGNAALSIIRGETYPIDLLKISFNNNNNELISTPIYAFSNVSYGYSSDKQANLEQYWYYGPLKNYINEYYSKRLAYFNKSEFSLDYCINCQECKKCFKAKNEKYLNETHKTTNTTNESTSFIRNLLVLFYKKVISSKERAEYERKRLIEYKLTQLKDNPDCNFKHEISKCELTQLIADINQREQIRQLNSGISLTLDQLPLSLFYAKTLDTTEMKSSVSEFTIRNFNNFKHKLIVDNEVYDLNEKEGLDNISVRYLNKSIKFLIDFTLINANNNPDLMMKKNKNVNLFLADSYINNSINFKNENLDVDLLEPFKRFYYSFMAKN